jgi:hypothetical protein
MRLIGVALGHSVLVQLLLVAHPCRLVRQYRRTLVEVHWPDSISVQSNRAFYYPILFCPTFLHCNLRTFLFHYFVIASNRKSSHNVACTFVCLNQMHWVHFVVVYFLRCDLCHLGRERLLRRLPKWRSRNESTFFSQTSVSLFAFPLLLDECHCGFVRGTHPCLCLEICK